MLALQDDEDDYKKTFVNSEKKYVQTHVQET